MLVLVSMGDSSGGKTPYLSGDTEGKSALFASVVWMRSDAEQGDDELASASGRYSGKGGGHNGDLPVRTNCPTVAEKPERKALKGYHASRG